MPNDLRYTVRMLTKTPGFTAVAVLTLAVGIGLSTTIFNGANPLLFRPMPFREPATLVCLNERNLKQGVQRMSVSYADFTHWQKENQVFSDLGLWRTTNVTLDGTDQPERVEGCRVSAGLFPTLGLSPALGRGFAPGDDQPGAASTVILGHALWQQRFGSDAKLIGQTIRLNGTLHTVIGIMPPRVRFPNQADLWLPLVITDPEATHGRYSYSAAARLKPGVTRGQVTADLDAIQARIAVETPRTNADVTALVRPIADRFLNDELRSMGWTMLGAVAFVLAVACANVANLFLTRALARRKEFAVRQALGAGRWRTIRQLLVESLVLGVVAGGLGFVLSLWGLDLLLRLVPTEIPYWVDFCLDGRVLAFAVGASLLTSLAFGLAPAWQVSRADVQSGLTETARGSSGSRHKQRLRGAFVVSEVALATLLLCGAGLMIRSLINLQQVDPGFNPSQLATFSLDLTSSANASASTRIAFFDAFTQRLRAVPGVAAAAACSSLPLNGDRNEQDFAIDGRLSPPGRRPAVGDLRVITPGYFEALGIQLVAGRAFTNADSASGARVIIVDTALARRHFGDQSPLGQHIRFGVSDATAMEVVGVVGAVKRSVLDAEPSPGFYVPYAQRVRPRMDVVLRTTVEEPLSVFSGVRQALRAADPTLPLFGAQTFPDMMGEAYWIQRFLGRLLVGFAGLALALAAVGIAGVMAYSVTQRNHEIGVRMALGAQPRDVLQLMLGQGMRLVLLGLGLGLVASLGLARLLTSQLYGVSWLDPLTLFASAAVFAAVATLAAWIPARRAAKVDPMVALRCE
jgi:putative ABC transport system permease protein